MRNVLSALATLIVFAYLLLSCKSENGGTSVTQGEGVVSGTVLDGLSGGPLIGVSVTAQGVGTGLKTFTTDAQGTYNFTFNVDSTGLVTLTFSKSGYRDTSIVVELIAGSVFPLNVQLTPKSVIVPPGGGGSGLAQTIAFLSANPSEVSVYGVGGLETSILSWEVRDSLGLPIDAAHAVTLTFTFVGPGGGEYVSPPTLTTNSSGKAFTTFNSGIRAGVVQLVANATVAGRTITSSPVKIIIDAGFAVQSHFTIAADRYNFAAWNWVNRRDAISVLVGDIYSNPVTANTAVYFHTSPYPAGEIGGAGVILPSVFTARDGTGLVDFISGNPRPSGPYAAQPASDIRIPDTVGYHYVVAQTTGKDGAIVRDSVIILWSGVAQISAIAPNTFNILNGQSQLFTFRVSDQYGHPLAAGTTIKVSATVPPPTDPNSPVNQVQLGFGVDGTLVFPDVIVGYTNFSFLLSDGSTNIDQATPVTLRVSVTGPNVPGEGTLVTFINGTVH